MLERLLITGPKRKKEGGQSKLIKDQTGSDRETFQKRREGGRRSFPKGKLKGSRAR